MKKQTKNVLLLGTIIVLTGVACTFIGRASVEGFEEKKAGPELTLSTENLMESKPVVNGTDVKLTGTFLNGSEKTEYTYTMKVDGTEKLDVENVSLGASLMNFKNIDITIEGYTGYVDTIDCSMLASVKDTVAVKTSVGIFSYGKSSVITTLDDYHYDAKFLHDGKIKIHITNKDGLASFELEKIVINKVKPVEENSSTSVVSVDI